MSDQLQELIQVLPVAACVYDRSGSLISFNKGVVKLWGREPRLKRPPQEYCDFLKLLTRRGTLLPFQELLQAKVLKEGRAQHNKDLLIERPDGSQVAVKASVIPILDREGQVEAVLTWFSDVAIKKGSKNPIRGSHVEEVLRRSESEHRSLVEDLPHGLFRSTLDGKFLLVNPALVAMLGYDNAEEVLNLDLAKHIYGVHWDSEERTQMLEMYGEDGRFENPEVLWHKKDGQPLFVKASGRLVKNKKGRGTYVEVLVEDITERKQLQDQFRQSHKMDALGQLAGGIAHDFNNLLQVIISHCHFARKRTDLIAVSPRLEEIEKAAIRAKWLTSQLLIFSTQAPLEVKIIDLNYEVQEVRGMLERLISEDIRLVNNFNPSLALVRADSGLIQQAIINLVLNARDAMPQGGILTVTTANVEIDDITAPIHAGIPPGLYVTVTVSDTGIGMDIATQTRLFKAFFTTKALGKGTGLGLVVVQSVVNQCGGYITVESEPGKGSAFRIYLPRVQASAPTRRFEKAHADYSGGSETVLLVEDDDDVRSMARDFLESGGYSVLEVSNGEAAIDLASVHKGPIDLLVTDVVMTGIGGTELVNRLAPMRPHMKVLYVSGYSPEVGARHKRSEIDTGFLLKPFTCEELFGTIRRLLNK